MRFLDPVFSEHETSECGKCCLLTLLRNPHFSQADWRRVPKQLFSSGVIEFALLNFPPGFFTIHLYNHFKHLFVSCFFKKHNTMACFYFFFFLFYFIFKLYIIVLVLPNIKMNPPQVYMCSPSWTLLPPPSPFYPSGSSQCTSPYQNLLLICCMSFTLFLYT